MSGNFRALVSAKVGDVAADLSTNTEEREISRSGPRRASTTLADRHGYDIECCFTMKRTGEENRGSALRKASKI